MSASNDSFSIHSLLRKPWGIASVAAAIGLFLLWYGCKPWSSALLQAFSALAGIAFLIIAARGPIMAKSFRRKDFLAATQGKWESMEAANAAFEMHEAIGEGVDPSAVRWEAFVRQIGAESSPAPLEEPEQEEPKEEQAPPEEDEGKK